MRSGISNWPKQLPGNARELYCPQSILKNSLALSGTSPGRQGRVCPKKPFNAVPTIDLVCHQLLGKQHHLAITSSAVQNPLKPIKTIPDKRAPPLSPLSLSSDCTQSRMHFSPMFAPYTLPPNISFPYNKTYICMYPAKLTVCL